LFLFLSFVFAAGFLTGALVAGAFVGAFDPVVGLLSVAFGGIVIKKCWDVLLGWGEVK